jgi:hypothetical protein
MAAAVSEGVTTKSTDSYLGVLLYLKVYPWRLIDQKVYPWRSCT